MKIAIGLFLAVGGGLATLVIIPYAFIVGIMSGFADDPSATLAYCIAAPLVTIGGFITGILVLQSSNNEKDKK